MPREYEQTHIPGIESEALNPTFIAQIASRLFNEVPEASSVPRHETDAATTPSSGADTLHDKTVLAGEPGNHLRQQELPLHPNLPYFSEAVPEIQSHDFYFLPGSHKKKQEPLGHHANKLTEQQNYSENTDGSYGLDQFIRRDLPPKPESGERFSEADPECITPFFAILNGGLPAEDDFSFRLLYSAAQNQTTTTDAYSAINPQTHSHGTVGSKQSAAGSRPLPFSVPEAPRERYYFLREPKAPIHQSEGFDVLTIRKDFPVLHQKIHGKQLVWFDNAATTQKPLSVINAVAQFYANDNSNIHRGAHTLAARATDAYEGAREKIRQFIGAGSASEIIYVRGTTEGVNLVAQTWGRKFIQPGDEIVLSILEHHANIVPWQMLAQEKGARIKVVPVNDRGEIIMEEYSKLLGPKTKLVSLTHASNGLGTILPVREMIQLAKRFDAKVLVDGAQSVAHIPVNVQDLNADFFVFSGHKIFAPTGIGVVYGKRKLLEIMPPWQGGGNMIQDVRFEETIFNEAPAKFEAGTPSIGDAVGLGAALDYVRKIGLDNIARYEHELTEYATEKLIRIPGLRIIGTARNKVGVVSFVLNNLPNEEAGKLLDREGIAVRTGHHCSQPSLRRFGVEGTIRPSLAFYNTKDEIDRLAEVINHIQRR
ncbi:MAG: cysteine desulfurase [Chlorobiaceae bacterium]